MNMYDSKKCMHNRGEFIETKAASCLDAPDLEMPHGSTNNVQHIINEISINTRDEARPLEHREAATTCMWPARDFIFLERSKRFGQIGLESKPSLGVLPCI